VRTAWQRHRRLFVAGVIAVLLIATLATTFGLAFIRPLPTIDGDERLLGLHERAEVWRDTYGVPHIFAADEHDAVYLQGYITAQDRLWQMDLYRRVGEGRLAEVLGEPGLESDRFTRTVGFARAAERDLGVASPAALDDLQWFSDGVNKFIEQHGDALPVEFLILGYKPEPWRPLDSMVIAKLQVYDAAGNYNQELLRAGIAERLGTDVLATLMPDASGVAAFDATAWAEVAPFLSGGAAVPGDAAVRDLTSGSGEGLGSNCWALAGSRTKSGKPLLAGDPHLGIRNPSIWYEIAMSYPDLDLIGFSFPGIPGVVIGHNAHVAWSFTYAYADTQDLFVEHQDPTDLHRFEYQGRFEAATFSRESITVKGRPDPVRLDVAVTRHGPIITPVVTGQKAQLALRWTALDPSKAFDAIRGMNRAKSFDEFRAAAADFTGAALSACYADTAGHIAYLLVGRLPDRSGSGAAPVAGWTGTSEWRGLLPASANTVVLDPPDGLILNANNRPMTSSSDAGWNGEWDPGFRYAYLKQQLDPLRGADVAAMGRLQNDYTSLPIQRFREAISSGSPTTAVGQQVQKIARDWDGSLSIDSAGAVVYEDWLVQMSRLTFADKLGDTLYDDYLGSGRPTVALYQLIPDRTSQWFAELGDSAVSGRDAVSGAALDAAGKDLVKLLGSDMTKWRWGDLHTISFDHPLAAAKPLDLIFRIGPVRRAGDGYSPNNGAYSLKKPFVLTTQPSERQIVDLGDLDASRSIIPVGQSGQPYSRHWGDQTPLWASGQYKPMALSKDRIGQLEGKLILRPR